MNLCDNHRFFSARFFSAFHIFPASLLFSQLRIISVDQRKSAAQKGSVAAAPLLCAKRRQVDPIGAGWVQALDGSLYDEF